MQAVVLRLPPPGLSFNIAAVFKTPSTGNPNSQLRQLLLRSSLKIPRNKSRNHPSITTLPFLRNKSERKRQGYFSHYGRFPPLYFRLEGSHYYLHSQSTTLHPETPLTHLHMQENLPHSGDLCELALGHFSKHTEWSTRAAAVSKRCTHSGTAPDSDSPQRHSRFHGNRQAHTAELR